MCTPLLYLCIFYLVTHTPLIPPCCPLIFSTSLFHFFFQSCFPPLSSFFLFIGCCLFSFLTPNLSFLSPLYSCFFSFYLISFTFFCLLFLRRFFSHSTPHPIYSPEFLPLFYHFSYIFSHLHYPFSSLFCACLPCPLSALCLTPVLINSA